MQGRTRYNGGVEDLIVEKAGYDLNYFKRFHELSTEGNKDIFKGITNNFFAVHARAATAGSLAGDGAHPFDTGNYVGMHNGTLTDWSYQDRQITDSQLMFEDMEKRGIKEVLEDLDPKSAYAIIVLDKTTGLLHFARNTMRPLFFCYNQKRNVMYWASEEWMLTTMLKRRGEEIHKGEMFYFAANNIYTIDPSRIDKDTTKMERELIVPKVMSTVTNYSNRQAKKKKEDSNVKPRVRISAHGNVTYLGNHKNNTGKSNEPLIPSSYCCGCQGKLSLVDQYFAKRIGHKVYLCNDCEQQDANIRHIN